MHAVMHKAHCVTRRVGMPVWCARRRACGDTAYEWAGEWRHIGLIAGTWTRTWTAQEWLCLDVWLFGCLVVWMFGCLAVGCLDVWLFGCLGLACHFAFVRQQPTANGITARTGSEQVDMTAWTIFLPAHNLSSTHAVEAARNQRLGSIAMHNLNDQQPERCCGLTQLASPPTPCGAANLLVLRCCFSCRGTSVRRQTGRRHDSARY